MLLAALDRDLQRLFAEHVFAGFGRGQRVLQVQRVRRHHVDDVDVLVRRHLLHRLVVVDARVGQAVFLLPFRRLGGRAGDDAREPAVARLQQRRRDLVRRKAAETHSATPNLRCGACALPTLHERGGGEGGGLCKKKTTVKFGHGENPCNDRSRGRRSLAEPWSGTYRPSVYHMEPWTQAAGTQSECPGFDNKGMP